MLIYIFLKEMEELQPNKGGAPTLYQEKYDEQAYKLCLLGADDSKLADFFEVDERTINNWKLAHPKFFQSIKEGKEIADIEVANSLYKGALDRKVIKQQAIKMKDVVYSSEGKKISETERVEIVELEEEISGDFRNQQFWLRNRKSGQWKDKQEVDTRVTIEQPLFGDDE